MKPWLARSVDRAWFIAILAAVFGFTDIMASPSRLHSLGSTLSGTGLILFLLWLWRRWTRGHLYDLPALLPNRRELAVLATLLATQYLGLGALLHPELLPEIGSQVSIWALYMVFGTLLYTAITQQEQVADRTGRSDQATLALDPLALVQYHFRGSLYHPAALGTAASRPDFRRDLDRRYRGRLDHVHGLVPLSGPNGGGDSVSGAHGATRTAAWKPLRISLDSLSESTAASFTSGLDGSSRSSSWACSCLPEPGDGQEAGCF